MNRGVSGTSLKYMRALKALCLAGVLSLAGVPAHAVIDVNKAFSPINLDVGQTSTLVITLFNSNTIDATATGLTDTLPAGLTLGSLLSNSCGGTASTASGTLTLVGGTIPAATGSGNGSCSVSAVVTAASPGSHVNTILATDVTSSEGNALANTQATITVDPLSPVTGTKVVPVSNVLHGGGTRSYVITLNNVNSIALTGVGFTDTLPAQLRIGAGGILSTSCAGTLLDLGGGAIADGDTGIRLTGGTIAANASCSISFEVRPTSDAASISANVTNSIPANGVTTTQGIRNSLAISGAIAMRSGGAVTKAFLPTTIQEGGLSTLTLTLTNRNLSTATAVDFTDAMPAGVTVANLVSNTCGGTLNALPDTSVVLTGGVIPPATLPDSTNVGTCLIRVRVTSATAGSYANAIAAGSFGAVPINYPATTATLVVLTPSPVSVAKAFNPATTVQTGTSLLTITLSNSGGIPAAITSFTDNLLTMGNLAVRIAASPAPSTTCGGTLTATAGTTTISLTGGAIPAATSCQITVPVQAEANGLTGARTNTLPPDSLVTPVGNNENTATAALTINNALTLAKAFFPATVAPSGISRLTVTITHANGALPFTSLALTDNLPATHTVAATPNVFSNCGGTVTANPGSSTFSLTGGSLPAGASSCVVAVDVQAPGGTGASTNTLPANTAATTAEGVVNRAAATAVLTRSTTGTPVTLNKSFVPTSINGGGLSLLTISLANNNAGALNLTNVALTDTFPLGMVVASPANAAFTGAGCTAGTITATPNTDFVTLSGATVNANSVCELTLQVTGLRDGNLVNSIPTGSLTSAQSVSNNNTPAATLTVLRNVGIGKVFSPAVIQSGGTSTLLVTVINSNDIDRNGTVTNTFTDNLPAGVTLASAASTNSCGGSVTDGAGGALNAGDTSIRLNGGFFPTYSLCTLSVVVTATAGSYTNTIAAGAMTTVEGSTNPDPASAVLTVLQPPTITKAFAPTSVGIGQNSTLSFTLTNPNSAALLPGGLTGATFADTLPAGVTVTLSGSASGSCAGVAGNLLAAGATSLNLTGLTIPAAGSCTVTLLVNAGAAGTYPNASSGVSTALTPVAGTGSNTATLTVLAAPTLGKTFSPTSITSGGTGTAVLTLTLANTNAVSASLSNPAFTDVFPVTPGAMRVATPLTVTNGCGGTLVDSGNGALAANDVGIRYNNGSIPAAGTCTLSVVVLAPASGIYLNTTTALNTLNAGSAPAATASFTVVPTANLQVTKDNGTGSVVAGQTTAYTITVSNLGPASGNGTTLVDAAVTGLSCTGLTCSAAGGAACPAGILDVPTLQAGGYVIPTLPAGSSVSFVLTCDVTASGQ